MGGKEKVCLRELTVKGVDERTNVMDGDMSEDARGAGVDESDEERKVGVGMELRVETAWSNIFYMFNYRST